MKTNPREKLIDRVTVLVPEKGSFPYFLKAAVQIAQMLQVPLRLFESSRFLFERPQKGNFYHEFLEEQALQNHIHWDREIFEDPLPNALKNVPSQNLLIVLKETDSFSFPVVLREASCPIMVIPKDFKEDLKHLLLAYVGGRFSDRALALTALMGKNGRLKVDVLTVGATPSPALRVAHSRAQYFFGLWKVKADYKILKGQVKSTLLEACGVNEASLLILGASETTDWKDHRFHNLSSLLTEEAKCPVMIVK